MVHTYIGHQLRLEFIHQVVVDVGGLVVCLPNTENQDLGPTFDEPHSQSSLGLLTV